MCYTTYKKNNSSLEHDKCDAWIAFGLVRLTAVTNKSLMLSGTPATVKERERERESIPSSPSSPTMSR